MTEHAAGFEQFLEPEIDGNRIDRRKTAFKNRILRSALTVIAEKGVESASVADIVKHADIAHGTFFNHFPSKQHLLFHIARRFGQKAYAVFGEEFDAEAPAQQQLEYVLLSTANALAGISANFKILISQYLIGHSVGEEVMQVSHRQLFVGALRDCVRRAESDGQLQPGFTPQQYSDILVGLSVSVVLSWSLEEDYDVTHHMQTVIDFAHERVFQ